MNATEPYGGQVNVIMIEVKSYGPHFPGDE